MKALALFAILLTSVIAFSAEPDLILHHGKIVTVDGAFSTVYGAATLTWFNVWAYQVDPAEVNLGDPLDMTKRLDGTSALRFPGRQRAA